MAQLRILVFVFCGVGVCGVSGFAGKNFNRTEPCYSAPYCTKSRYRSIDGSCNNLQNPHWGVRLRPYARLVPYNYGDGISSFPTSVSGLPLPSARLLSTKLFPQKDRQDVEWSLITQQWGQVITHDMSSTGAEATPCYIDEIECNIHKPTCCTDDGQLTEEFGSNHWCAPILVPSDDPYFSSQNIRCLNFTRTTTTRDRGWTLPDSPAEPLSVVTSWMDLSLVYGNNPNQAAPLGANQGGRLKTEERGHREWPPQNPNFTSTCPAARSPSEPCYLSGDLRTNQNTHLTLVFTILVREHNRIADSLYRLNPHWNDETVFQEARRIHIAQVQHINYYEYLPILLGYENMVKNKLIYPDVEDYVNDYDSNQDPAVLDEHASAAFRHFHTLIRGHLAMASENREYLGSIRLSDWYSRPLILEKDHAFDNLARGLATQAQDSSDQFFDHEVTNFFNRFNHTFGLDLRAISIQRGRDHGLGFYLTTRKACGLPEMKSFEDLLDLISPENVKILQSLYKSVEDIDLVVGGSLERPVSCALAGPTFITIMTMQFHRTRVSDRLFYENGADPDTAFTPNQLTSIRKGASMARLLCDNAGIQRMQPNAFQQIGPENQLVPCDELPEIDLTLWQESTDCN